MTTTLILYGIKNCQTVKKAQAWLEQHDKAYRFHDVRKDGLTAEQLHHFMARGANWRLLLNRSSTTWKKLSAEQQADLDREKTLALILKSPTLLKRPILDTGDQLLIGFSAELYQNKL